MDAFLSQEAFRSLAALSLVSSRPDFNGFLIGHRRGHRFIIETILSSKKGFFPSPGSYHALDRLLEGKIIGFFSFHPEEKTKKKILAPFAYGKLFLDIESSGPEKISLKAYAIDFKEAFYLEPLPLKFQVKKGVK